MNVKEIIETLNSKSLSPNKKFGQNFLCNDDIIEKILNTANLNENDNILEIGPGLGAMTGKISTIANSITAVEIDSGLYNFLSDKFSDKENVRLIHSDFLKVELEDRFNKVVANLPYYCSSEILFKIATFFDISLVVVMVQKEMADRLNAKPGTKEYGAMTASLRYYYNIDFAFNVSKNCFFPKPDITSSIIVLSKNTKYSLDPEELSLFHDIIKSVFWGRRKTILKSITSSPHLKLDKGVAKELFAINDLDPSLRGDMLSTDEFVKLASSYKKTFSK